MTIRILSRNSSLLTTLLLMGQAYSWSGCPAPVKASAQKEYPGSKVSSCKKENEKGRIQYEVKLESKDKRKVELDIDPQGALLLTEEIVPLDSVPKEVIAAFEAKYPKTKPRTAEKQTKADGKITYELGFMEKGKAHEVTFDHEGTFVEVE